MKKLFFIFSFLCVSICGFGQVIEPEFMYECGILNENSTLTICEKMNIYINRDTGKMFFLDP